MADEISANAKKEELEKKKYDKMPQNTKFKQQRLDAWKPILLPATVLPVLFAAAIFFLSCGIALIFASNSVKELKVDYTDCSSVGTPDKTCAQLIAADPDKYLNRSRANFSPCQCIISISLDQNFNDEQTYIFYALDNFYQNHRRYVKSRSDTQLRGLQLAGNTPDCDPLYNDANGRYFMPAGMIANSLFNDTITLQFQNTSVAVTGKGISWQSDRDVLFKNPDPDQLYQACFNSSTGANQYTQPPAWSVNVCLLGNETSSSYNPWSSKFQSSGLAYQNEDLIVWMRTAAAPNFRKIYRRVQQSLPNGVYQLQIDYNYPVTAFNGKKSVIISTTSWLGGKNPFLGIAYLVVGAILFIVTVIFYFGRDRLAGKPWKPEDCDSSNGGSAQNLELSWSSKKK